MARPGKGKPTERRGRKATGLYYAKRQPGHRKEMGDVPAIIPSKKKAVDKVEEFRKTWATGKELQEAEAS
jgi:hypothetical protein